MFTFCPTSEQSKLESVPSTHVKLLWGIIDKGKETIAYPPVSISDYWFKRNSYVVIYELTFETCDPNIVLNEAGLTIVAKIPLDNWSIS